MRASSLQLTMRACGRTCILVRRVSSGYRATSTAVPAHPPAMSASVKGTLVASSDELSSAIAREADEPVLSAWTPQSRYTQHSARRRDLEGATTEGVQNHGRFFDRHTDRQRDTEGLHPPLRALTNCTGVLYTEKVAPPRRGTVQERYDGPRERPSLHAAPS